MDGNMMEVSKTPPKLLSKDLLQKALASYKNDSTVEVQSFSSNSNFSEHFASSMFQCDIEFTSKSGREVIKVVIKVLPENDELKSNIVGQGANELFKTEIKMYKETIPAINQLFERHGMKVDLAPE
jgi:hypothetical protein